MPGYSTDVVEPDWFADGDFTWLEAADAAPAPTAAPESEAAAAPEPEPMPEPEAVAPPAPAAEPEPVVAAPPAPAPPVAEESPVVAEEVAAATATDREPTAARTAARTPAPTPAPARPPLVAPIAEPFGEELIGEILPAQREVSQPAAPFVRAGIRPVAPTDAAADLERVRLNDDEFEQLAHDEGWDEAEIRAIRAFLGRPGEVSPRTPLARTAPRAAVEPVPSEAPPASRQTPAVAQRRSPVGGAFRRLRRLLLG
jgi:hypothetical protein